MKEYGIFIRCNGGLPYRIHIFNDFFACQMKLYEFISLEEERGRPYYVDNDFFENKYPNVGKLKYFRVDVRDVTEWSKHFETDTNEEEENSNIIFLNNFRKTVDN